MSVCIKKRFGAAAFALLFAQSQLLFAQQGGPSKELPPNQNQVVGVEVSELGAAELTPNDFMDAGGKCSNGVCVVPVEQLAASENGQQALTEYQNKRQKVRRVVDPDPSVQDAIDISESPDLEQQSVQRPKRQGVGTCLVVSGSCAYLVTTYLLIVAGVCCLIVGGSLYGACHDDNPGCPKIHGERGFDTMIAGAVMLPVGIVMACIVCCAGCAAVGGEYGLL